MPITDLETPEAATRPLRRPRSGQGSRAIGRRARGPDRRADLTVNGSPQARGVSRAQIALAWLRTHPIVVAPLVGASKTAQIDDAVASLEMQLTDEEITDLERAYTLTERPAASGRGSASNAATLHRIRLVGVMNSQTVDRPRQALSRQLDRLPQPRRNSIVRCRISHKSIVDERSREGPHRRSRPLRRQENPATKRLSSSVKAPHNALLSAYCPNSGPSRTPPAQQKTPHLRGFFIGANG